MTFSAVPKERWDRVFGERTVQEQVEIFRAAKAAQERRRAEGEPEAVVAVHGENKGAGRRLYGSPTKGIFDFGLGVRTFGRSDRNRKMRALGLREV